MGSEGPKLLLDVGGRTALEHVVRAFLAVDSVGEIVVTVPPALLRDAERAVASIPKPRAVRVGPVPGGATRQESVAIALRALTVPLPWIAVHDVARALVSPDLIRRVAEAARGCGAAIPACPVKDSVKEVAEGRVVRSVPREVLQAAQTPQIFSRDILARAHARAAEEGVQATDDAALVERTGAPIAVVPGESWNLKMTEPQDRVALAAIYGAGLAGER